MARQEKTKQRKDEGGGPKTTPRERTSHAPLRQETLQGIAGVASAIIGIFSLLAAWNLAGPAGRQVYSFLTFLFGYGYYLVPILLFVLSAAFFKSLRHSFTWYKFIGAALFFFSGLGIIEIAGATKGGIVGFYIATPLMAIFDIYFSLLFLVALLVISLLVIFEAELSVDTFKEWRDFILRRNRIDETKTASDEISKAEEDKLDQGIAKITPVKKAEESAKKESGEIEAKKLVVSLGEEASADSALAKGLWARFSKGTDESYSAPDLSLLERDKGKPGVGDIKANANIIKRTLQNFSIDVEMDEVSIGPSVTRYALKPAEGVKLSKIVALQDNLALALAAHPIRIEAPIPGKSLVGIEIPNTTKTTVGLGTLISDEDFQKSEKPLMVALGKGISGKSHFGNLAKMPHLLIAGATGSGKSVTIHALITSLLYRNSPDELKFIMIDPKRVELTLYNKIPHLLTPVITDAKKAILALKWAAKEMSRRYDILEQNSVRDIESYHRNVVDKAKKEHVKNDKTGEESEKETMPDVMPYIVIVIDELADIMQTYPRELEAAIVRLAQMSRAVGIHLMLSTQRPSVNVITGLIKANVPARIALQVASQIDSRTILDMAGAEKLLGAGDMLYLSGDMSKPARIQSAYVSETELKKVVSHLSNQYKDALPSSIELTEGTTHEANSIFEAVLASDDVEDDDDLYEDARACVMEAGKASTSYIQRKLRVGYSRAARLMDLLEERGVIGPADGSKPRLVIDNHSSSEVATDSGEPKGDILS